MEVDSKIVEEALQSICILNKEMGGVLSSISWIKTIIMWQSSLLGATFIAVLGNLFMTRKNGNKRP